MALLEADHIFVSYGKIDAIRGVSFSVDEGQLVTLIGANGAGKSTIMRTLTGLLQARSGSIRFAGQSIANLKPHEIARKGIMAVPEGRRIFGRLSVCENLEMGAFLRTSRSDIDSDKERMVRMFPRLGDRWNQLAGTMSGGEQQMLATARALMARPRLLLLDEPSMGLSPLMVEKTFETIQTISREGITILFVEQNARQALEIADIGYVLQSGTILMQGTGDDLIQDEAVQRAYLG